MLTGKPPWHGLISTKQHLYDVLKTGTLPEIPRDLTADCLDFIYRCLKYKSIDRTTIRGLLEHSFIIDNQIKTITDESLGTVSKSNSKSGSGGNENS